MTELLDGKFAFVIYDEETENFIIGRDHMGLCPLYWGTNESDGSIWVSSELKGLDGICTKFEIFPPGHVYRGDTQSLE
jgi:asparagine synthase (glutamine-hydrolysing)